MEDIMQYLDQSTFAMLLTIYLLVRFEGTLKNLNESINQLKIEIARLQQDCKLRQRKDED